MEDVPSLNRRIKQLALKIGASHPASLLAFPWVRARVTTSARTCAPISSQFFLRGENCEWIEKLRAAPVRGVREWRL